MKNFNIDTILKTITTACFIGLYGIAGFFVFNVLIHPQKTVPITNDPIVMQTITATPTILNTISISPTESQKKSNPNVQIPKPTFVVVTHTPTPDPRCIIFVDGVSYDVTVFRNNHSGGDIFDCGSDMTTIFYGQHTANMLRRMSQYKI